MHPAPTNTGSHPALAHQSALAARPDGRRITLLYATDPNRPTRFSASLDDVTLDYALIARFHELRGEA